MRWTHWLALGVGSLVILTGCVTTGGTAPSREKTLFERVGGKPYLTAIVDDFVVRLAVNRQVQHFVLQSDRSALQTRLFTQLCAVSGGPCKYTGQESLRQTPQGMVMTSADFDVMLAEFGVTLDKFHIVEPEKRELLAFLGPLRQEMLPR